MADYTPAPTDDHEWVQRLKMIWRSPEDMKSRLRAELFLGFSSAPNPYHFFLFLAGELKGDVSLVAEIFKVFLESWLPSSEFRERRDELVDVETRRAAFDLALKSSSMPLLLKFDAVFGFADFKETFLPRVEALLAENNVVSAARIIVVLKVQSHYDFESILIPLLLSDQAQLAEAYVADDEAAQKELVRILDYWSSLRTHHLHEHLISKGYDLRKKNYKLNQLNQRVLGRLTTKLVKKFRLNEEEACPLLLEYREIGFMRHQTREFLFKKSVDEQTWADNVDSVVRSRPDLAPAIVEILFDMRDFFRAAKWAKKLNLSPQSLPPSVFEHFKNLPDGPVSFGVRRRDHSKDEAYHPFPLAFSDIIVVDTVEKYETFLGELQRCLEDKNAVQKVGIDAEWPPHSKIGNPKVALLQVAFDSKVFLLDILSLSNLLSDEQWVKGIGEAFVANPRVCKLGFGASEDLKCLTRSVPALQVAKLQAKNIIELNRIVQKLESLAPEIFDSATLDDDKAVTTPETKTRASATNSQGLSGLVKTLFGKPLDKRPQCSDWNRRPLRESQMVYAALDSFCLLQVYDELYRRLQASGRGEDIDLEKMTLTKISEEEEKEKEEKKKEKKRRKAEKAEVLRQTRSRKHVLAKQELMEEVQSCVLEVDETRPILTPKELKIVCDTMLQGLGRQLRLCGCDVRILSNDQHHDEAAKIALAEDRVILTSGKTFSRLSGFVAPGRCICVNNQGDVKLECIAVLKSFNVRVEPADIFSRCQLCNSDKWTLVPTDVVFHLWDKFVDESQRRKGKWSDSPSDKDRRWTPVESETPEDASGNEGPRTSVEDARRCGEEIGISFDDCTFTSPLTKEARPLDLAIIPELVFQSIENFYLCSFCGKLYWDGTHYRRTNRIYGEILGFEASQFFEKIQLEDDLD